ncbi:MAG: LamG domain-containing protein [Planctomycetota bacterium]|nr:LamG domain-containing protein [Planctomycetota bacterium]
MHIRDFVAAGLAVLATAASARATVTAQALYRLGEDGFFNTGGQYPSYVCPIDSSGNNRGLPNNWGQNATDIANYIQTGDGPAAWPTSTKYYYFSGTNGFGDLANPVTAIDNVGVEIWARRTSADDSGAESVFGVGTSNSPWNRVNWGINIVCIASQFRGMIGTGLSTQSQVGAPYAAAVNEWVHLAVVRADGVTTFYVNGAASGASSTVTPAGLTDGDNAMMSIAPMGGAHYIGDLDEARIFTFESGAFRTSDLEIVTAPAWPNYLDGDFNKDGEVGPEDFGILKDGFGLDGLPFGHHESWTLGDANDDGEIGPEDFGMLKDNFGLDGGPTGTYPLANVPEPATLFTLLGGAAGLLLKRRAKA